MSTTTSAVIVMAIGFISGVVISLQEIGFDYFINKVWMGWGITLRKVAFSVSSLSVLFGLGAFLSLNWEPAKGLGLSPDEVLSFAIKIAILVSIVTPISGQVRGALASREDAVEESTD